LVKWFWEANGVVDDSKPTDTNQTIWNFDSVEDLRTIGAIYKCKQVILMDFATWKPMRTCHADDYLIFCDQLIHLPCYAVNIRPESSFYTEVISALDGQVNGKLCASTFGKFEELLFSHYEDMDLIDDNG
jgi:hypothetical protein